MLQKFAFAISNPYHFSSISPYLLINILVDEYGYLVWIAPANGSCNLVNYSYSRSQKLERTLARSAWNNLGV